MSTNPDGWLLRDPMLRKLPMTGGRFAPLGATNMKPLVSVDVLPPEVTATSAEPTVARGAVTAMIAVLPDTVTAVAGTPPMLTIASLPNPVPVMVTGFPPVVLAVDGEIDTTFSGTLVVPAGELEPQATSRTVVATHTAAPIL